jgi:hypothetical protein
VEQEVLERTNLLLSLQDLTMLYEWQQNFTADGRCLLGRS